MKINKIVFVSMILGVFWGVIFLNMFSGTWQTKVPEANIPTNGSIISPDEIKGWMKADEVADYMNLPVEKLFEIIGVDSKESPQQALKDIAHKYNMETDDFKERLEKYNNNLKDIQ